MHAFPSTFQVKGNLLSVTKAITWSLITLFHPECPILSYTDPSYSESNMHITFNVITPFIQVPNIHKTHQYIAYVNSFVHKHTICVKFLPTKITTIIFQCVFDFIRVNIIKIL